MSDIADIYSALMEAKAACGALESWQRNADGRDSVRNRQRVIERSIAACERLTAQLRDGRKHVEPPEDYKHTSCFCSAPTCSPPCSWCTDPANHDED